MANSYELRTLRDIWDKVPADRIEACLSELSAMMCSAKAMQSLMSEVGSNLAGQQLPEQLYEWPEVTVWVDDGKGYLETNFGSDLKMVISKQQEAKEDGNEV